MSNTKSFKGMGKKLFTTVLTIIILVSFSTQAFAAGSVTFDFSVDGFEGYSSVFGGAINDLDSSADINSLRSVGITFTRRDFYLVHLFEGTPYENITIQDYKNNVNGAADPNNWNWSKYDWINTYDTKGLKIMLILSYNCKWNTYTGEWHGVPKDWAVYQDMIKKIYTRFKGKVDFIEVYNEPDNWFLDIAGSPYTDKLTAYKDIYYNASTAIRSVDTAIPIGGPAVTHAESTHWGDAMLKDARIKDNVNFLSYHIYANQPDGEVAVDAWRNMAKANGKPNMPVYITEWNYDWHYTSIPMNNDSVDAIPYVAQRLSDMIRENLNGAGYFAFNKLGYQGCTDFYSLYSDGSLTPKMSVYRLMSKKLGLGDGDFNVKGVSWVNSTLALVGGSAVNAVGKHVGWATSVNSNSEDLNVNFKGLKPNVQYTAYLYEASRWQDATNIRQTFNFTANGSGDAGVTFWMPYKSLVGLNLTCNDTRTDLALNKTVTVDSTSVGNGAKAVDNNEGTRWASAETPGTHWLKVDLGTAQTISKVLVNWETAYGKDYRIQTSTDNVNWTDVATVTGNTKAGWKEHSFTSRSARYVRVYCTAGAWNNLISMFSINVYR